MHFLINEMETNNSETINELQQGVMVTIGMFDGVHVGHQHVLQRLKQEATLRNAKPVAVTFDRHPREVLGLSDNGFRYLSTPQERERRIHEAGIENVIVLPFSREIASLSAVTFVKEILLPKMQLKGILLGYDNMFGNKQHNDFDQLPILARQMGFDIVSDEPVILDSRPVSSTLIRKALQAGNLDATSTMLGCHYGITGTVVSGRQVGRKLGFATANLEPEDNRKALPLEGVYAVRVFWDNQTAIGMANLGPQPTFGCPVSVFEIHLLDTQTNLYGAKLKVEFISRLRDIQKFDSPEALIAQLTIDEQHTRSITSQ